LFDAIGLDLTQADLVFHWRTAVVAYAVGALVTVLAAYLPARRAARVPPVAAMRDDLAMPESSLRRRLVGGAVLTVLGTGLLTWGAVFDGAIEALGAGVLGVFVGVALLCPVISPPIVAVIAGPFPRLFGAVGTLARENAGRNPRRTSATATALMIGLALVSTMAVLGRSATASVDDLVGSDLKADYVVSNATHAPFSPTIAEQVAALPGVSHTATIRYAQGSLNGTGETVAALDPAGFGQEVTLTPVRGAADLTDQQALVSDSRAEQQGWQVGDTVTLTLPAGSQSLQIAGTFVPSTLIGSDVVVRPAVLAEGAVTPMDSAVYVTRTNDTDAATVSAGISQVLAGLPTVTLKDQAAYAAEQREPIDRLLAIVYALLGLAVVIAVLGIVNTLALSVIERTREIGLLRAVGMSRRQVRAMVRLESVAISILGGALGVGLGLVFGVALQRALTGQGITQLSVPLTQLLGFVMLAGVIGVIAAVLPARRAARTNVLQAISTS
jgi:putative ABC transport system permease protein